MKKWVALALQLLAVSVFGESVSDEVQNKLNAIRSMSASFTQTVTAGKRALSESSGEMALLRPGRFRWQTKDPMEQIVVADSKQLWVYDIDLEQVTVKKQEKGLGGTPGLFLSGYNDTVARDFDVTKLTDGPKPVYQLHAKSPKENYQEVKLSFDNDKLISIEFFDQLNQHTMVRLKNIKTNPSLESKLFQFKPPKGVDIVRQ